MVAEPSLLEVTLRERPTGAGLKVTLEPHRALLIRELDDHMTLPHASTRGMETAPSVVFRESPVRIRCEARIETGPVIGIPEYVDEAFATTTVHDGEMVSKHDAPTSAVESRSTLGRSRSGMADGAYVENCGPPTILPVPLGAGLASPASAGWLAEPKLVRGQ